MSKDPLEKLKFMEMSAARESRQQKQRVIAAMQARGLGSAATHAGQIAARLGVRIDRAATDEHDGQWITWEAGR